ncbi:MAG: glycosyltransferase family 2 protein [Nitriliruptorales bacterium]
MTASLVPSSDDRRAPLVVVLPVHDEETTVAEVIARVPPVAHGRPVCVVVVDDGSSDASPSRAREAGAFVVSHPQCRGLGAAIRTGFGVALQLDAWAVAFLDADGEYDPRELPGVVAPIARDEADYVVGSRFAGRIDSMLPHRRIGNVLLTWLTSLAAGRRLSDGQSGFRALGRAALTAAHIEHDYNYAQVLTLDLLRKGYRYAEVPIRYHRRRHGRSFVRVGRYLRHVLPAMVKVMARTPGGARRARAGRVKRGGARRARAGG